MLTEKQRADGDFVAPFLLIGSFEGGANNSTLTYKKDDLAAAFK